VVKQRNRVRKAKGEKMTRRKKSWQIVTRKCFAGPNLINYSRLSFKSRRRYFHGGKQTGKGGKESGTPKGKNERDEGNPRQGFSFRHDGKKKIPDGTTSPEGERGDQV